MKSKLPPGFAQIVEDGRRVGFVANIVGHYLIKSRVILIFLLGVIPLVIQESAFVRTQSAENRFLNRHGCLGSRSQSQHIPQKDKKRLEYFFRRILFWDPGAYVLMGSKPCSISVIQDPFSFQFFRPSNIRFWLGWKTWKKYEKYFHHPSFSILKEARGDGSSLIVFIHHLEFLNTISSNIQIFEKILQKSIEPNQLLKESESKSLFRENLKENDFLIGIVLGFGVNNAWLYYQNHSFLKTQKEMTPFVENKELERFANYISSHNLLAFTTGALFEDFSQIPLPGFVVDPDSVETARLKVKYSESRCRIIKYYEKRDFLEATLELLQSYSDLK